MALPAIFIASIASSAVISLVVEADETVPDAATAKAPAAII